MAGTITVFGGTGFIGRHLVALLLRSGKTVRMAVRHPGRVKTPPAEATNSLEIVQADILDDTSVGSAIMGADAVFNPRRHSDRDVRADLSRHPPRRRSPSCFGSTKSRVMRVIHMSALGSSPRSPAMSDRTKAEGEEAVRAAFPQATVVRPSLVFGEDDHFFSRFAAMIRSSPLVPLIGGGTTKFQPVFIGDMVAGMAEVVRRPDTAGKTYEFGGPQVYSFKELLELLMTALNRHRILLPIPFALAEMQAAFLELLPNPPLTRDRVRLLKTDKVVSGTESTLGDLGVQSHRLEEFLAALKSKYS